MKLLYATSIIYPSTLANRIQILKTSKGLENILKQNFLLGASDIKLNNDFDNQNYINIGTNRFSLYLAYKYIQLINKHKFTHVFIREEVLLIFIYIYSRIFCPNINISYEAHWMFISQKSIINFLFNHVIKKVNHIFTTTKGLKDEIIIKYSKSENDIEVLPDAVDLEEYNKYLNIENFKLNYNLPQDKCIITYVGTYKTLGDSKGVDLLVNSFVEIYKENKDIFLLIIGIGDEGVSEINKILIDNNISNENYKLINRVAFKEVSNYLRSSNMMIMPFPKTKHYEYYMSPMKLFEYMASNIPIITTDLLSVREILPNDNACIYIKPDNIEDMKKSIIYIKNNNEFAKQISSNAYEIVKNYTWHKRAEKIINIISK